MLRSEALAPLSRDHLDALALAVHVARAADGSAAQRHEAATAIGQGWQSHIAAHFMVEERWLLPLLPAGVLRDRLHADHTALRALVADGSDQPQDLRMFAERLRGHVRWEERELFPAIERLAPAEVLAELGERLARRDAT